MNQTSLWPVMGRDGLLGYVDTDAIQGAGGGQVSVQLTNGSRMSVPREALKQQNGSYYLPVSGREIANAHATPVHGPPPTTPVSNEPRHPVSDPPVVEGDSRVRSEDTAAQLRETPSLVVPVVEERLDVDRRTIETGGVRVTKEVHERQEVIDEPTVREVVNVERIAVNRVVDGPQDIREEGTTVIIPVVEEMLVVEKRLVLKEEVRVTRSQVVTREPQTVTLRREEANVQRWNHDESMPTTQESMETGRGSSQISR